MRSFKKKQKTKQKLNKKKRKKEKEEGFSQLFFFTKLTIQSQKKINFLMPLHCKHCKERAIVVTQFWPIAFLI
jgi:chromatin segregation and condensation protein Rec8/ScpA/Scc1 (kleisin family)